MVAGLSKDFQSEEIFFKINISFSSEEILAQTNKIEPRQAVGSKLTHRETNILLWSWLNNRYWAKWSKLILSYKQENLQITFKEDPLFEGDAVHSNVIKN